VAQFLLGPRLCSQPAPLSRLKAPYVDDTFTLFAAAHGGSAFCFVYLFFRVYAGEIGSTTPSPCGPQAV